MGEPLTTYVLPVVGTLAGVALGAFVAELRVVLQDWRDRRRILRSLLFHLLELRFEVKRRDPVLLANTLREVLPSDVTSDRKEAGLEAGSGEQFEAIAGLIRGLLPKRAIAPDYASAVVALAPSDPILAYALAGKEGQLDFEQQLVRYFEAALKIPGLVNDSGDTAMAAVVQREVLAHSYVTALESLAEDSLLVAWRISIGTWTRTRHVLKRQDNLAISEQDAAELKQLVGQIATAVGKQARSS